MNDEAILLGQSEVEMPPWASTNLPAATTRVVGRSGAIDHISQKIRDVRCLSIVGPGGIGKTTVAMVAAEQAIPEFKDGVWLVDFASLRDPVLVPNAIATATGLIVHSGNVIASVCRFLKNRETLLVLDNCEHLLAAISFSITQILVEAGSVRVVATSREPLGIQGEHLYRLPALSTPSASSGITAQQALEHSAVQLFVDRAADRLETFEFTDKEAPAVAEICRNLEGIALAIELAAMRVDVFGIAGLRSQLDDKFWILSGRRAGLERHRTLLATLDWSYDLLSPIEAKVLRAVSVFAGIFRAQDGAALSGLPIIEVDNILKRLAAKSLLSLDSDAGQFYRPLGTTRAYCLGKLAATGEYDACRLRHAEYLCERLEYAATSDHTRSREWNAVYSPFVDDLRGALGWAGEHEGRRTLLVRLTAAGILLWNHFSLTDEGRGHLSRAIAEVGKTEFGGSIVEMNLQLTFAGAVVYTRGMMPEAKVAMERALEIAVRERDTDAHLRCLRIIATYQLFRGEHDAGVATLENFNSIAANEDPSALPEGATHLAAGEIWTGKLHQARERLERLLGPAPRDSQSLRFLSDHNVNVMIVVSHAQWLTGSPDTAATTVSNGVEASLRAQHELSISVALAWACPVYFWSGRYTECSRYVSSLREIVDQHDILTWRPWATFFQGALICQREGGLGEGIDFIKRGIADFRRIGQTSRVPYYLSVLGGALNRQGRLRDAETTIRDALDLASAQNEKWCLPEILRVQALNYRARDRVEDCEATLIKSIAAAKAIGAHSWEMRAANDLAKLWHEQLRTADAQRLLRPIYGSFTEGFDTVDLQTANRILAIP